MPLASAIDLQAGRIHDDVPSARTRRRWQAYRQPCRPAAHSARRADRRVWRKLHLGVDKTTREILAADVSQNRVHDSRRMPALLSQISGAIAQVSGDWGYNTRAYWPAGLS
jgi:hypothetical protein